LQAVRIYLSRLAQISLLLLLLPPPPPLLLLLLLLLLLPAPELTCERCRNLRFSSSGNLNDTSRISQRRTAGSRSCFWHLKTCSLNFAAIPDLQAVPICVDTLPDQPEPQPWFCDTSAGLFVNQSAYQQPNPSNTVCCLVSCTFTRTTA
jgi:hypothetical protein